jgi:peroxiredoxin
MAHLVRLWHNKWFNNGIWLLGFFVLYLLLRPMMQGEVLHEQAPDIQLTSLNGETLQLRDLQGQAVLIHFWATWCPICTFSRDGIEHIAQDYRVISIATQSGDNDTLLAYAAEHGMNPTWIVNDEDGALFQRFGARAVPADFIINAQGDIAFVEVGLSSSWGLRARLWWANQ